MADSSKVHSYKWGTWLLSAAWLVWIGNKGWSRLLQHFPPAGSVLNSDAEYAYLPAARLLIDGPWHFLTQTPLAYNVAPLGYIWPAIWQADPLKIQTANCVLFILSALLLWHCSFRLGGWIAGVISTYLMVSHPTMVYYAPQVLTESLYIFGLFFFLASAIEFATQPEKRSLLIYTIALGLAITLLTRPILQLFILGALITLCFCYFYITKYNPSSIHAKKSQPLRQLLVAIGLAIVLPILVIVKNGIYFNVWSISTGSGAGLYYGVSPFKMGSEPVFSGFSYDIGTLSQQTAPESNGNPLDRESDKANARVALEIVKNTSAVDNLNFFLQKFKSWIFYSTPELRGEPTLRIFRLRELIIIIFAILIALIKKRIFTPTFTTPTPKANSSLPTQAYLILVAAPIAMALQLTPVLYNDRYNIFSIEPFFILASGVGASIILKYKKNNRWDLLHLSHWTVSRLIAISAIFILPGVLYKYALGHETWGMDPHRPGPTAVAISNRNFEPVQATNAHIAGKYTWLLDNEHAALEIPLLNFDFDSISQNNIQDGIWRIRLSIQPPKGVRRSCHKAMISVTNAFGERPGFRATNAIDLKLDGKMHTYAIFANHQLRPAGPGNVLIQFSCPESTTVHWHGIELLKVTTAQAAREWIDSGTPIEVYRNAEPE